MDAWVGGGRGCNLAQLDRIGIIELRLGSVTGSNSLRLSAARRGDELFREHALLDYFAGGFDGPGEGVPCWCMAASAATSLWN